MTLPKRYWHMMSKSEIHDADTSNWIAVLPLGATEQHGPHLPLDTDTIIANCICGHLASNVPDTLPMTILAPEEIGYSPEHGDYPGTRSLSYNDAIERWISTGKMLHACGIRKMLLMNAHGGNAPLMTIVATELRCRFDMLCVATSWTRFGSPEKIVGEDEKSFGIHGGDIETSIMLHMASDLVDMSKAKCFETIQSKFAEEYVHLRAYGPHAFGWKMQDLNPLGVVGNASQATAEKGEALLEAAVRGLSELLEDINGFDPARLKNQPSL